MHRENESIRHLIALTVSHSRHFCAACRLCGLKFRLLVAASATDDEFTALVPVVLARPGGVPEPEHRLVYVSRGTPVALAPNSEARVRTVR